MTWELPVKPAEFDFFQAVRILEGLAFRAQQDGADLRRPVGEGVRPGDEVVRFSVPAASGFPAAAISRLRQATAAEAEAGRPPELSVSFLGLIGPSGVLPEHYTADAIAKGQDRDYALHDFLDIFHHRAIAYFYRAWKKYRLPVEVERGFWQGAAAAGDDPFTAALRCLIGLGSPALRERLHPQDATFVYYAGHYSRGCRSAAALAQIVSDYFEVPAQIEQFQGRWINIPPAQRSQMPTPQRRRGAFCRLNHTAIAGARVWTAHCRFRVRLGPLPRARFTSFLPGRRDYQQLVDLVRLYVNPELEFDIQPVVLKEEVPIARLKKKDEEPSLLNRNGWLVSRPRSQDAADAVFLAHSGSAGL